MADKKEVKSSQV